MPMSTVSQLGGLTLAEYLDPPFRSVNYVDEIAVVTMSTLLRFCWILEPPQPQAAEETTQGESDDESALQQPDGFLHPKDLYRFIGPVSHMSEEEKTSLPRNPNKDDWRSNWRQQIAYVWRHVFYDVSNFLYEVNPSTGTWNTKRTEDQIARYGQSMGSFAVYHSDLNSGPGETAMIKKWPATNVVVVPMFVEKGVKVSFDRTEPGDAVAHLQTWNDDMSCCDAVYLRQDVEIAITVEANASAESEAEKNEDKRKTGVAAVFVYATLIRD